jgi:sulfopyruvate decarboxylase TPP-binding subunit
MIKAKEFWNVLCKDLDYKFFSGVATSYLKPLYKAMDSDIMHYVPAADESVALGLASGAHLSGVKSGIIIDMNFMSDLFRQLEFNKEFKIPILIIGYSDKYWGTYPPAKHIRKKEDILELVSEVEKARAPGIMVFGEGELK